MMKDNHIIFEHHNESCILFAVFSNVMSRSFINFLVSYNKLLLLFRSGAPLWITLSVSKYVCLKVSLLVCLIFCKTFILQLIHFTAILRYRIFYIEKKQKSSLFLYKPWFSTISLNIFYIKLFLLCTFFYVVFVS